MYLNTARFLHASRAAGLLAVVSALTFITQARAAGPTFTVVPANNATGVSSTTPIVFTFSAAMDTSATMAMFLGQSNSMFTTFAVISAWSADSKTLTCTPNPPFPSGLVEWVLSGQDTVGNQIQGLTVGTYTVGASSSGGGCNTATHTNTSFTIEESWLFVQTSASPPTLDTTPYAVLAEVSLVSNLTASGASLTLPNSSVSNLLDILGDGQTFQTDDPETNLTVLNNTWQNGTYTFNVSNTTPAFPPVTVVWNFAQPNAPQVLNYAAAQVVDPTKPFTLTWNAFTNRLANTNQIVVNVGYNPCAGTGFATNLPGTATSVTIPAGALLPGSNYVNSLLGFLSDAGTTSASPKYTAGAVRGSITSFTLTTIGGSSSGSLSLTNPVWAGGALTFTVTPSSAAAITVEYSSTLQPGSWTTLVTSNSTGPFTVSDTPPKTVPMRFYRAHQ